MATLEPGLVTPTSDNARRQPGVIEVQGKADSSDFQGSGLSAQASLIAEGGDYARAYLERLQVGIAEPGELAVILGFLANEMLYGACRVLEKALRGSAA